MKTQKLFALHLEDVEARIKAGKLAPKTKRDYSKLSKILKIAGIAETDCENIGPAHFQKVMGVIEGRGHTLRTQKNIIGSIKSVFNWGGPEDMNFFPSIIFGKRFKAPSGRKIEVQQEEKSPTRFFEREEILRLLPLASPKMKVAILLGINCGFYPSDTIAIQMKHIHLIDNPPFHDFRRVKTLQQRRAVLWPDTIDAITEFHDNRIQIPDEYVVCRPDGKPHSLNSDKLAGAFRTLLKKADLERPGVGLGSLRHTYATVIDSVPDQSMIDLTMGHVGGSLQKRIYRQLNLNEKTRLTVLANTVHQWLFGRGNGDVSLLF